MTKSTTPRQGIRKLRIIGGQWRSRKLEFPELPDLRPTPDRIREMLFSWLAPYVSGARCLDLYCGSGALGFECLSRGAAAVTMVDTGAAVQRSLLRNKALLACDNAQLVRADVLDWLARTELSAPFDVVFVDPPYQQALLAPTLAALQDSATIKQASLIYTEAPQQFDIPAPAEWALHREKRAGSNRYCIYRVQTHAIPATMPPL